MNLCVSDELQKTRRLVLQIQHGRRSQSEAGLCGHGNAFPLISCFLSCRSRLQDRVLSYLIILEMFGAAATAACRVNDVRKTVSNAVLVSS